MTDFVTWRSDSFNLGHFVVLLIFIASATRWPTRALRIFIALDIFLFSVFTLGDAKRNETMSAAAWSLEQDGKFLGMLFRPMIDALFYPFEPDHCANAWINENKNK